MTHSYSKPVRVFTVYEGDLKATLWRISTEEGSTYFGNFYRLGSGKIRRWRREPELLNDPSAFAVKLRKQLKRMTEAYETSLTEI